MNRILPRKKAIAYFFLIMMLAQVLYIPANAKSNRFIPDATAQPTTDITELVDIFSGDLNYTLPVLDVPSASGNYPIKLNYKSGNYRDAESSWVGLGWELSIQRITRQVKGVPDEFLGDTIQAMHRMDPSVTVGAGAGVSNEVLGKSKIEESNTSIVHAFSVYQNNLHGLGYSINNNMGYHAAIRARQTQALGNLTLDSTESHNNLPFLGLQTRVSHRSLQSPSIPVEVYNTTTTINNKIGNAWAGSFAHGYIIGYYNVQHVVDEGKFVGYPAFGALHSTFPVDIKSVLDVGNDTEQEITRTSDLPTSQLTADQFILKANGQNESLMLTHDSAIVLPHSTTKSRVVSRGFGEDKAAASHEGRNSAMFGAKSYTSSWQENKGSNESQRFFKQSNVSPSLEPSTNRYARQNDTQRVSTTPFHLSLTGKGKDVKILDSKNLLQQYSASEGKESVIQMLTNEDILGNDGKAVLPDLQIKYRDTEGDELDLDRVIHPKHHLAAITSIQRDGVRYTYGLPAYVLNHEEVIFSGVQEGTSKFVAVGSKIGNIPIYQHPDVSTYLSYSKTPQYAESFLLTSIVGTDYIDVLNDGITSDDAGHWVKFSYKKTTTDQDPYAKRNPFIKAHLIEGNQFRRDDKGTYSYTEKELWYIDQIETNTHIAKFITEERKDAYGAKRRLQDEAMLGKAQHALKEIQLYSKEKGIDKPIRIVKLAYDYSLFSGAKDSAIGQGKLTLKKVWIENFNTTRGANNAYIFDYAKDFGSSDDATDRWGITKAPLNDPTVNPYVDQQVSNTLARDRAVSSGNLASITTPSGQTLTIEYESDDYAYVQHLPAQQMVPLVNATTKISDQNLKITFKLDSIYSGSLSIEKQKQLIDSYLENASKVSFNIRTNLLTAEEDNYDQVQGTAAIDFSQAMGVAKDQAGNYAYGYFHVKPQNGKHPFVIQAWKHLQHSAPWLLGGPGDVVLTSDERSQKNQIEKVIATASQVRHVYENFFAYCDAKAWGRKIDASHSYVRLNSPDKIKVGGEARVKQINITDGWNQDAEGLSGYWLEYTQDNNGVVMSSGVALNEPTFGKEENVLLDKFPQLEYAYPGHGVGYSRVNVYTLASASLAKKPVQGNLPFPKGEGMTYGTKGVATYQFYTAHDFPTLIFATGRENKTYAVDDPSGVSLTQLVSSQGYSVVTNDMHGKLKSVAYLRQQPDGVIDKIPVSSEKHEYFSRPLVYDNHEVFTLTNLFDEDSDGTLKAGVDKAIYTLGQYEQQIVDLRETLDESWRVGEEWNSDDMSMSLFSSSTLPIKIKGVTSNATFVATGLKTAVTTRSIHQSGIRKYTDQYMDGQHEITNYLKFDKVTSQPVLLSKSNGTKEYAFEQTLPAYRNYKRMGPASTNLGKAISISNVKEKSKGNYTFSSVSETSLCAGDELIVFVKEASDGKLTALARAVYAGETDGIHQLTSDVALNSTTYSVKIVRSGNRNQLNASSGRIRTAAKPVWKGVQSSVSKSFIIPKD